tara:strand:+ start:84 stop:467 length:384 start_codon:yes stop_codon:yes gene_type:complete
MANYIKVPLKDTTPTGGSPRYGLVKVDDVYDCQISGSGEHIRLYTTLAAAQDQVQVPIIEYFAGGNGAAIAVVTAQDIENLKDLIVEANQNPGSNPIFNLIGAGSASVSDLPKYQVDTFTFSSIAPI